jgi:hypothetical protein
LVANVTFYRPSLRTRAALSVVALCVVGVSALASTGPTVRADARTGASDVAMFQSVIDTMREGGSYYAAMADALQRGHYPMSHSFNWRTPLLLPALASVPPTVGPAAAVGLCIVLLSITVVIMARQPKAVAATVVFMQCGVLMTIAVPESCVMGELWAGLLIGLSVCAYIRKGPMTGMVLGLFALFVRELSAPYCVLCTIAAMRGRRWREVAGWCGGALLYAGYYTWHILHIQTYRPSSDLAPASSWLASAGLESLLSKIQWHAWLLLTPRPASALVLLLLVAGIGYTKTPAHVRLTSAVYVTFFLVAGQAFNEYWGMVAWPTWAFACGYGVDAVRSTIRDLFAPSRQPSNWSLAPVGNPLLEDPAWTAVRKRPNW